MGRQGAGIGCNCGWSRGEQELAVLIVAPVGHVVSGRLSDLSWMTSSTCIRPDGITSYLLMSPCLVVFAPLKAAVHGVVAGADAFVLQPASLLPYIRRFTEG